MNDVNIHVHISEDPYTRILNSVLQDSTISFCARGVLAYLFSKPADWTPMMRDVQRNGNLSEYAQQKIMRELRQSGYAWLETTPTGQIYHVTDIPQNPPLEIRMVRNSTSGISGGIQTKEGTNERKNTNKINSAGNDFTIDKSENNLSADDTHPWDQDAFEIWWRAYPRQLNKKKTKDQYLLALKKTDAAELLRGAESYAKQNRDTDPQYIKRPDNWLRDECWWDTPPAKARYIINGQIVELDPETAKEIGAEPF